MIQEYLYYFLKSSIALTYIEAYARGAVRNNFGIKKMANLTLPIPSIDEQQRIVSELDRLVSIIADKQPDIAARRQ